MILVLLRSNKKKILFQCRRKLNVFVVSFVRDSTAVPLTSHVGIGQIRKNAGTIDIFKLINNDHDPAIPTGFNLPNPIHLFPEPKPASLGQPQRSGARSMHKNLSNFSHK